MGPLGPLQSDATRNRPEDSKCAQPEQTQRERESGEDLLHLPLHFSSRSPPYPIIKMQAYRDTQVCSVIRHILRPEAIAWAPRPTPISMIQRILGLPRALLPYLPREAWVLDPFNAKEQRFYSELPPVVQVPHPLTHVLNGESRPCRLNTF